MPKVSVLLPVYNGERFLEQAVASVLAQTFSDWELILINDGSTDTSGKIISKLQNTDQRIKAINQPQNLGLVQSLNEAVAASAGEYLARLDSDDAWTSAEKLSSQVKFLDENSGCDLLGTWAEVVSPEGRRLYDFCPPATDAQIRRQILCRNCFVHSSVVVRKSALLKAGGYRQEDLHVEDYALWLRMGQKGAWANLNSIMVRYCQNPLGITGQKKQQMIKSVLNLIKLNKNYYPNYWLGWIKWRIQTRRFL